MSITTYAQLQAAAANWLVRGDLTARIPEFIALAEARLNRVLRVRQMEARADIAIADEFEALPDGFAEVIALSLRDGSAGWKPAPATLDQIEAWKAGSPEAQRPGFFAVSGPQLQVYPPPDKTYAGSLTFYRQIPALSDLAPTNWLLSEAPDLYLYGVLLQAAPFLRDAEALLTWQGLHDQALRELQATSRKASTQLRTELAELSL